jgi:TP901 family phage tail tape measure protein
MRIIDQLVYKITGDSSGFDKAITTSTKKVDSFGLTAKKVFAGLGIGISIGAITNQVRKSIEEFSEYERTLAKVSTLYGDVAVNQDNLTKKTIEISNATGLLSSQINEALYSALSAGVEVTEDMSGALGLAEKSAKLASAGFTDTETALSATIKTLNAYKLSLDETDRIQRILMQTQNKGITTVGELGKNLAKVTPTAAAFGYSFENVGAAIATMTAQGIRTEISTTYLAQIMTELGKAGTTASEGLKNAAESAGLAETDAKSLTESGMSLGDILDLLDTYAKNSGKSIVDMFGSVEAGKGALALTGSNLETFNSNLESMSTNADLVGDGFQKMINTVAGQSSILRANLSNLRITAGEQLEPALTGMMQTINEDVMPKLTEWVGKAGNAFGFIGDVASITARHIKYAFDDIKEDVSNILENLGIDPDTMAELKISMKPFGELFDALKESVASGDYSTFWAKISPALKEGAKLAVALQAGKLVLTGLGLLKNTFGVAGAVAGMSVAVAFAEAQGDDNWKKFAYKMALGLGAGLLAAGLTKNPATGFWVASIAFSLDLMPAEQDLKRWSDAAEKEGAGIGTKIVSGISNFLFGDKKVEDAIVDGVAGAAPKMHDAGLTAGEAYEQGVKDALGIRSPSKVMEQVGEYAAEGLVNGATRPTFAQDIADAYNKWFNQPEVVEGAGEAGKDIGEAVVDGIEGALETSFFDKIKKGLQDTQTWLLKYQDEIGYSVTGVNNLTSAWGYLNQAQANNNAQLIATLEKTTAETLKNIDIQTQAKLEAEGVALETTEERLIRERDEALATGDAVTANLKDQEIRRNEIIAEAEEQKRIIQEESDKQKIAMQREDVKRTKAIGITQAIIDTANAVIGFLADPGGWPGVGLSASAVGVGAAQIAAINSTPLPSFDVGSIRIPETTQAVVHKDEMILTAQQAEQARREGITIAPNKASGNSVNLVIYLDGKEIARNTIDNLNSGSVGTIKARVVK